METSIDIRIICDVHAETIIICRLEQNVFPWLGNCPIADIEAPDVLAVLRRVESRGALETAHRIKSVCGRVSAMQSPQGGQSVTLQPTLRERYPREMLDVNTRKMLLVLLITLLPMTAWGDPASRAGDRGDAEEDICLAKLEYLEAQNMFSQEARGGYNPSGPVGRYARTVTRNIL